MSPKWTISWDMEAAGFQCRYWRFRFRFRNVCHPLELKRFRCFHIPLGFFFALQTTKNVSIKKDATIFVCLYKILHSSNNLQSSSWMTSGGGGVVINGGGFGRLNASSGGIQAQGWTSRKSYSHGVVSSTKVKATSIPHL